MKTSKEKGEKRNFLSIKKAVTFNCYDFCTEDGSTSSVSSCILLIHFTLIIRYL